MIQYEFEFRGASKDVYLILRQHFEDEFWADKTGHGKKWGGRSWFLSSSPKPVYRRISPTICQIFYVTYSDSVHDSKSESRSEEPGIEDEESGSHLNAFLGDGR